MVTENIPPISPATAPPLVDHKPADEKRKKNTKQEKQHQPQDQSKNDDESKDGLFDEYV